MKGEVAQMETLTELERSHFVEHSTFDGLGLLDGLFFIIVAALYLVGNAFRKFEVCFGGRYDCLGGIARKFSELQEIGIQFGRDKGCFNLELGQGIVEGVGYGAGLLEKAHYVGARAFQHGLGVQGVFERAAQDLYFGLEFSHAA